MTAGELTLTTKNKDDERLASAAIGTAKVVSTITLAASAARIGMA